MCERYWVRRAQRQIQGNGIHTSLLISSASLSMRKMRAFVLDGPCRSLCSSGMSVLFSRFCSANENKNQLQSGGHPREKKEHNLSIHFAASTYFVKPIKNRSCFTHSKKQVEIKIFKWTKNRLSLAILWDLTFYLGILTLPLVCMFRHCRPIYAFAKPKNIHSINIYWSFLVPLM